MMRAGCVRNFERFLRDQNPTTQRLATGQVKPSRIPYFKASS
jgi:hypothetical protein